MEKSRRVVLIDRVYKGGIGVCLFLFAVATFVACSAHRSGSFDPKTCMETIPRQVKGLKILQGPRTEQSIIRNMVPVVCNAQVLFRHMKEKGKKIDNGTVLFWVRVEYTGEVYEASVHETTIESKRFLREVADFIMDTDFMVWARTDSDTVFLYPMVFRK
jgi:hypothetical protein